VGWHIDSVAIIQPPPVIGSVSLGNSAFAISWNAVAGQRYRVQYKTALDDTNWNDLLPDVTATGLEATVTTPVTGSTQRFYRVFLVP